MMEKYGQNDDEKKKDKSYWKDYLKSEKKSREIMDYLANLPFAYGKIQPELRNREDFENKLYEAIDACREEMPREWKITCENSEEDNFENWLVKNGYETLTEASKFHGGLTKALSRATEKRTDINVYQKLDKMVI
jgi:hypothetical protein